MRIVIIEDELMTAEDLSAYILELASNATVNCVLSSVNEAIQYFTENSDYDLVFSDIQLSDGLCFEIFKQIQIKAPIIFCTAFDEYMIDAFKSNGIDYIFKPFDKLTIKKSLNKFEELKSSFLKNNIIYEKFAQNILNQNLQNQSILIYLQDKIIPINVEDIAFFYIHFETTKIYTFTGNQFPISKTLEEIDKAGYKNMFRVNRQFIINRKAINEIVVHFNQKLLLKLKIPFSEKIIISKEKKSIFLNWLSNNSNY